MQRHFDPNDEAVSETEESKSLSSPVKLTPPRQRNKRKTAPLGANGRTSSIMNIMRMRSDTSTSFIDESGNQVLLKTSAVLNPNKVMLQNGAGLEKVDYAEKIKTHRPMTVTEYSSNGSPLKGETPGRTNMYRAGNTLLSIFTNNPSQAEGVNTTPLREVTNVNFQQTSAHKAVKPKSEKTTVRSVHLDAEKIKAAIKKTHRNQNKVMKNDGAKINKASATKYANAAGINPQKVNWEWLHLIAYRFVGEEGQHPENLGCGTAYANTDMLAIETALPELTKIPYGFTLTAHAHYVEIADEEDKPSQALTRIEYIVCVNGNEFKATFNAQLAVKPIFATAEYHVEFFRNLALSSKESDDEYPCISPKMAAIKLSDNEQCMDDTTDSEFIYRRS